ncbi:MAG: hypothetical protein ACD_62C00532G0003 [uncultured bacterium]|nr:MAG: hypothetical protein ACD_62C00532G0003 [uncultured bacterium]
MGILGIETALHFPGPNPACRAVFGDLLKKIRMRVKKERKPWGKRINIQPSGHTMFDVFQTIVKCKGQFLYGCGARFTNVITGDRYRVPFGQVLCAIFDGVDHQFDSGLRRDEVRVLGNVFFQDVILDGAAHFFKIASLLLRRGDEKGQHDRGRAVDGHGDRDLFQIDAVKQGFHVFKAVDGHTALAHLSQASGIIGIVPHQCGKMKRRGEACLPVLQKIFETLVGVARRTKARKLTHGPQTTAVHGGVDPACKRESSGKTQITILCESGEVFLALEAIDLEI